MQAVSQKKTFLVPCMESVQIDMYMVAGQYLAVEGYLEEDNQWKAHGIDENWNRPSELQ